MADKSVIANIEARIGALIEDHRRLSALCRELTAERDALKIANRAQEERIRALDAEVGRMQLAEGLSGGGRNRAKARAASTVLCGRWTVASRCWRNPRAPFRRHRTLNRDNAR